MAASAWGSVLLNCWVLESKGSGEAAMVHIRSQTQLEVLWGIVFQLRSSRKAWVEQDGYVVLCFLKISGIVLFRDVSPFHDLLTLNASVEMHSCCQLFGGANHVLNFSHSTITS